MADWLIAITEPNRESVAAAFLSAPWAGWTVYLPVILVNRIIRSRVVPTTQPLFSRYLFVQDEGRPVRELCSSPGVSGLLAVAGAPARLDEEVIAAIAGKCCEQVALAANPPCKFKRGEHVRTDCGVDAIFLEAHGEARARLLVKLFARSFRTVAPLHSLTSLEVS